MRVRLTGEFLRNTGQIAGGDGQSRWNVRPCACGLCAGGDFVAVDEHSLFWDPAEPETTWRHFRRENLEPCR